jgi:hypothetical protein
MNDSSDQPLNLTGRIWEMFRRRLPPPFRGARWLFYVFALAWATTFVGWSYRRPWQQPLAFEVSCVFLTTLCVALWTNHVRLVREGQVAGWRLPGIVAAWAIYDLFRVALLALIIGVVLLGYIGPDESIMNDRQNVTDLGREAKKYEHEIETKAMKQSSLAGAGHGMTIAPSKLIAEGIIGNDGVIVVHGENPPATVVLAPRLEAGKIVWTCNANTQRYERLACRD